MRTAKRHEEMIPDSAVKLKMPEARRNLGAAKASDCEVSKSIRALAHRSSELEQVAESTVERGTLRGQARRLRCGKIVPRAFCPSQLWNPG